MPAGVGAIAGLGAVAGAGAAAFATAGIALGVFGLAVKDQFKQIIAASVKYETAQSAQQKADLATAHAKSLAAKGGKEYTQALAQAKTATNNARKAQGLYKMDMDAMPKSTRDTANALQKFKDTTKNWSASLAPETMPIFTKALTMATAALPKLTPLVTAASGALGGLVDRMAKGASGGGFSKAIDTIASTAKETLPDIINTVGNLIGGIGNLIALFIPYAGKFSGGLEGMTASFLKWTQGLKGSKGFDKFMGLVKETGPIVVDIFKKLAETLAHGVSVFSPYATIALGLGKAFAFILSVIPVGVMQVLYQIIVASAIAIKLYNAYVVISAAVTGAWTLATRIQAGVTNWLGHTTIFLRIQIAALWVWQKVIAASTYIWAAAQRVLNMAFWSSPVTWIIVAIVALVVIIVLIATKTTWFQTAWRVCWNAIKTASVATWNGFLKPVFNAIWVAIKWVGDIFVWLYKSVIKPTWSVIYAVIKVQWWGIKVIFALIVANVKLIAWIFMWLYNASIKPAINLIAAIVKWLWNNVAKPVWNFMISQLKMLGAAFMAMWSAVKAAGNGIAVAVRWLWNNVAKPVWATMRSQLKTLGAGFSALWSTVKTVFGYIGSKISSVWNYTIKTAFSALKSQLGKVKEAFVLAQKGIGIAWGKLKDSTKGPVKFFVNTVYNDGLRAAWNNTAGKIPGVPDMAKASLPRGFAKGGYLGTGTKGPMDKVPIMAQAGEYVIKAKRVREIGKSALDWLNNGSGTQAKNKDGVPGYSLGGWIGDAVSKVTDVAKGGFDWGAGLLKSAASGALSTIFKPIRGMLNSVTSKFPQAGMVGTHVKQFANAGIDKLISYVKGKATDGEGGNGKGGTAAAKALGWARTQAGKAYQWGGNGNPSWDCSGFMSAIESVIRGQSPHRRWSTHAFSGKTAPAGWTQGLRSAFQVGITAKGVGHTAGTLSGVNVECRGGDGCIVGKGARGAHDGYFDSVYGYNTLKYANGGMIPTQRMDSGGTVPRGLSLINNTTGAPETLGRMRGGAGGGGDTYHFDFSGAILGGNSPKALEDLVVTAVRRAEDKGRIKKGTINR